MLPINTRLTAKTAVMTMPRGPFTVRPYFSTDKASFINYNYYVDDLDSIVKILWLKTWLNGKYKLLIIYASFHVCIVAETEAEGN